MAIDSAQKRALVMNASLEWEDSILPFPNSDIEDIDQVQLLSGYYPFEQYQWGGRHEVAMNSLFPIKGMLFDE